MLEIHGLRKTYASGVEALKGVDLVIRRGDFHALLGPNGAGKSTTIGIVASLINKTSGRVIINGIDIDADFPAARRCLGLVPQEFNFNQFEPAFEIVANQAGYYGLPARLARRRAEKYLKQLGLWERRGDEARALSGGMKRRMMIARALVHEPALLILDEPTAGVDVEVRRMMWDFLRELNARGVTIILTTHYLEEAERLCRHISFIHGGVVAEDFPVDELWRRLDRRRFVLRLARPLDAAPALDQVETQLESPRSLAVSFAANVDIAAVFAALNARGVQVCDVRAPDNRLEEFFLNLIDGGKQ